MNALQTYLRDIVEPTFADFQANPHSARHAYLACVTAYHAIDRATYPKNPGNRRKDWRARSLEFTIVDMVAHKLKHVVSDDEKAPIQPGRIPLSALVFGKGTLNRFALNTTVIGVGGLDIHGLHFIVRNVISFLHQEAEKLPGATS